MKREPLPHQADAIKAVIKALETENRTHMVMACGTGKTLTALWITEKINPKTVVIFVPSLALISQFLKEWVTYAQWDDFKSLAICSDNTVTKDVDSEGFLWEKIDFPVTHSSIETREFLQAPGSSPKIIFCTYQSAWILGNACHDGIVIDFGIFDEAHKTAGYEKTTFGFALSDENLKIKKRLFMTATPRHGSPRKLKTGEQLLLYSMDDEELYGKRCYEIGFRKAIQLGLICNYEIIISTITNKSGHIFNQDYEIQEKAISLQKAIEKSGANKVITFHSSISHAKYFAHYLASQKIHENILHINSRGKVEDRSETMSKFRKSDKSIITNAKCLTEGVDVPTVDMVAFLNPKSSRIDIVQAIGRALRKAPGKEKGYIFLPLLVNNLDDLEHEISGSEFKAIWEILNALVEQDSDLADAVKYMGQIGSQESSGDAEDLFLKFMSFNNDQIKDLIEVKILGKLISDWDKMFYRLSAYKDLHGTTIPDKTKEPELYKWVLFQKGRKNYLSTAATNKLNSIGFDWSSLMATWDERFLELVEFKKQYGHVDIGSRHKTHAKLGTWLEDQKNRWYKDDIKEEHFNKLSKLGVKFRRREDRNHEIWMGYYAKLIKYKKKYNSVDVPQREGSLGKWCNKQRNAFKANKMPENRYKLLTDLGFKFNPIEEIWTERFNEYKKYKLSKKDDCFMGKILTDWCTYQRRALKKGALPESKIKLLTEVGFDFIISSNRADNFSLLKSNNWKKLIDFEKEYGHANVPVSHPLYSWVKAIKERNKAKGLSQTEIEALGQIGFNWKARTCIRKKRTKSLGNLTEQAQKLNMGY